MEKYGIIPMLFFQPKMTYLRFCNELLYGSNSFLPFIIINKQSNIIVGSTRYLNIDYDNHRMEIGHTWVRKSFRRTAVNTETKLLMLQYAFEKLNCIAIEIRTDVLNTVSRRAIERLGAKEDGIIRNHKIMKNGRIRDTICYSIIRSEWPLVKENLLQKMNHYDNYACPLIREGLF